MSIRLWKNYIRFKNAEADYDRFFDVKLNELTLKDLMKYFLQSFPGCVIDKNNYPSYYELKVRKGKDDHGNSFSFIILVSKQDNELDVRINVNNEFACYKRVYEGKRLLSSVIYDIKLNLIHKGVYV